MEKEVDKAHEVEEALLDNLSFYTKEFYEAQANKASFEVIRLLDQDYHRAYELCLVFGVPALKVAKRLVGDTPPEKRGLRIEAHRKILKPFEYRELADYFGVRR